MTTPQENQAVKDLLVAYAEALNTANIAAIPSFFSSEGCFMPDTFKTLGKNDLKDANGNHLRKTNFHIVYTIKNVNFDKEYAFVEAIAIVHEVDIHSGNEQCKTSRDFFVLHKEEHDWKIYRYLFNNVTLIQK